MVESTGERLSEKASYYSAVCLKTWDVEWMKPARRNVGGFPDPTEVEAPRTIER